MNAKRIVTGLVLFPLVAVLFIFANEYVIDIFLAAISVIGIYEYFKAFKENKKANPICWIGYLVSALIIFLHMFESKYVYIAMFMIIPTSLLIMFFQLLIKDEKYNVKDIAITLLGICYIPIFLVFLSLTRHLQVEGHPDGKILMWFILFAAWGTDIFAYVIGKKIGKHHFTKISPNKTIEGAIAGTIGGVILGVLFALCSNIFFETNINYLVCAGMMTFFSIIGQIGDLSASAIKRYCGIKDYSELFPGHGGMLDRIDSVIMILPFAYFLLQLL